MSLLSDLRRYRWLLRLNQPALAFVHDVVMAALSFGLSVAIAYQLRFGWILNVRLGDDMTVGTALFTATAAAVFWFMGLYRGIWRYASIDDLLAIVKSVTAAIVLFTPAMFFLTRLDSIPRTALLVNWVLLILLLAGPRVLYRVIRDKGAYNPLARARRDQIPVLLLGVGDEADQFIRHMARDANAGYRVVGLLDEKEMRVGRGIRGVRVLGTPAELELVVAHLRARGEAPQKIILTRQHMDPPALRRLVSQADSLGLTVARMPQIGELRQADRDHDHAEGGTPLVRPIAIEDLLGRPQTVLDRASMVATVAGRRVLVTGAGGTIGGELARQIAAAGPARLVLCDNSEFALYGIDLEMAERSPRLSRRGVLTDVRDRVRVEALIQEERPEIVFHAAARKHVPIIEAHPADGALTNAVGTRIMAETCRAAGVAAMVLISTDKAINPSSVMGATKRLAEAYCQALDAGDQGKPDGTRFVTVRFGNVLGSTGSVVPLFQRQLARGGPLTVTHPEVTRYFMTVREAVELVLQATALGLRSGTGAPPRGGIFVLDMGEPVRILDLAQQMIRLAGLRPNIDIKIEITGLRPGEKLYEELFHATETLVPTERAGILLGAPRTLSLATLARGLDRLEQAARAGNDAAAMRLIHELVPEFRRDDAAPQARAASAI
ncbi:MAG: polysaccharide biosynthesis protein [Alphaproteobacteria bacterium]|nr:polysaccharide biosynthesis protein [Alphaproteobacteria bacterium]